MNWAPKDKENGKEDDHRLKMPMWFEKSRKRRLCADSAGGEGLCLWGRGGQEAGAWALGPWKDWGTWRQQVFSRGVLEDSFEGLSSREHLDSVTRSPVDWAQLKSTCLSGELRLPLLRLQNSGSQLTPPLPNSLLPPWKCSLLFGEVTFTGEKTHTGIWGLPNGKAGTPRNDAREKPISWQVPPSHPTRPIRRISH